MMFWSRSANSHTGRQRFKRCVKRPDRWQHPTSANLKSPLASAGASTDVCEVPPVAAQRGGSPGRARDRDFVGDRALLVEPVRSDVRRGDPQEAGGGHAPAPPLALASRRDGGEDHRPGDLQAETLGSAHRVAVSPGLKAGRVWAHCALAETTCLWSDSTFKWNFAAGRWRQR